MYDIHNSRLVSRLPVKCETNVNAAFRDSLCTYI